MTEQTIRTVTESDNASLGVVFCEGWQEGYRGILSDRFLDGLTPVSCAPKKVPEDTLAAEISGKGLAGLVNIGPARDGDMSGMEELRTLYVRPCFWRRGIGTELFRAGAAYLRKMGYTNFYLWVLRENTRARMFYEKLGMHPDGTERTISVGGETVWEVRYVTALSQPAE